MHAGQGFDLVKFDAFPEQVDGRSVAPSIVTRCSARAAGARDSFEGADSVRDVGLDANAGHRKIGQDSKHEGAEVSQKKRPHQGDTERIEDQTPDY